MVIRLRYNASCIASLTSIPASGLGRRSFPTHFALAAVRAFIGMAKSGGNTVLKSNRWHNHRHVKDKATRLEYQRDASSIQIRNVKPSHVGGDGASRSNRLGLSIVDANRIYAPCTNPWTGHHTAKPRPSIIRARDRRLPPESRRFIAFEPPNLPHLRTRRMQRTCT